MIWLKMKKIQYDNNWEAAKITTLSSGKINMNFLQVKKYERLIKVE